MGARKNLPATLTTSTKNHSLAKPATADTHIYPSRRSIDPGSSVQPQANLQKTTEVLDPVPKPRIEEELKQMAPSTVLVLALAVLVLPVAPSAARAPPGSSPLVSACMEGPFPAHCIKELGPRLLDIQKVLASASPRGALIAGAPGTVDFGALVSVAMEAATEAGAVATTIFEGKLPGFNTAVPDFQKCLMNCSVTMASAVRKIHGANEALRASAHDVAFTLANRAIVDVSSCALSCGSLTGDVRLILQASLVEFQKMLKIAVAFINKLRTKTPPGPPPLLRRP
ncbi:unnamed protein product [Alopecurus aequalis]